MSVFVYTVLHHFVNHINGLISLDKDRHLDKRERTPEELREIHPTLVDLKRQIQYQLLDQNSGNAADILVLMAVLPDFHRFYEVDKFLVCLHRLAMELLKRKCWLQCAETCTLIQELWQDRHSAQFSLRDRFLQDRNSVKNTKQVIDLLALSLYVACGGERQQAREVLEQVKQVATKLKELLPDWELEQKIDYLLALIKVISNTDLPDKFSSTETLNAHISELETKCLELFPQTQRETVRALQERYSKDVNSLSSGQLFLSRKNYRQVVCAVEYSGLMAGKTIENVLTCVCTIIHHLETYDMFGLLCCGERPIVALPTSALSQKLATLRGVEQFNQCLICRPRGGTAAYAGLNAALKEGALGRVHTTLRQHFKGQEPVRSDFILYFTTGQVLDSAAGLQDFHQFTGTLVIVWVQGERARFTDNFKEFEAHLLRVKSAECRLKIVEVSKSANLASSGSDWSRVIGALGVEI